MCIWVYGHLTSAQPSIFPSFDNTMPSGLHPNYGCFGLAMSPVLSTVMLALASHYLFTARDSFSLPYFKEAGNLSLLPVLCCLVISLTNFDGSVLSLCFKSLQNLEAVKRMRL